MLFKLIVSVVLGALIGFIAGKLMETKDNGFIVNAIIGIAGGFIGGLIGNLLGIGNGWIMSIILSIVGACLLIFVLRKIFNH
ncbi:MAG: GlsB/YeaQ/YmgE family stress response membrane protein [Oscillospiraceae bacterium]|nr:GlsB/YeaQ/YmgE family stress response membrane protein [Oscillospiraceae bacterium]